MNNRKNHTIKKFLRNYIHPSIYNRISWLKNNGLRYYPIHRYQEIDGWLSTNEAIALYDLAKSLPGGIPTIVELGSWQGKSTFVLSQGLKHKPASNIYCVDPFNADGDLESKNQYEKKSISSGMTLKEGFLLNCDVYGMNSKVEVMEGYSYEFSTDWKLPIDILFIDADHSFNAVYKDYLEWAKYVRQGGYIVFHDVFFNEKTASWSGPGQVVNLYLTNDDRFVTFKFIDTIFIAKRLSDKAH